jgi:hypothetical protein
MIKMADILNKKYLISQIYLWAEVDVDNEKIKELKATLGDRFDDLRMLDKKEYKIEALARFIKRARVAFKWEDIDEYLRTSIFNERYKEAYGYSMYDLVAEALKELDSGKYDHIEE